MQEGAIALIDCLGFKGIWQRSNPDTVLRDFKAIREEAPRTIGEGIFATFRQLGARIRVSFLSDTVVIGVDAPNVSLSLVDKGRVLGVAAQVAQKLSEYLLKMEQPLAARGSITYGSFEMDDTFIIGPAVDEAAELYEIADGAFIWISPRFDSLITATDNAARDMLQNKTEQFDLLNLFHASLLTHIGAVAAADFERWIEQLAEQEKNNVRELIRRAGIQSMGTGPLTRYAVPMKNGPQIDCWVCTPISGELAIQLTDKAMQGSDLAVMIKRQNTLRYLRHILALEKKGRTIWQQEYEALVRGVEDPKLKR